MLPSGQDSVVTQENKTPWIRHILLVVVAWVSLIGVFEPTFSSMVAIWDSSETYTHGYVVLPITLWLIWRMRDNLTTLRPAPYFPALLLVIALCAMWLLGRLAGALVVEHYALVGLMLTSVWVIMGWPLVWALFFPLTYLLMMVPVGDFMLPSLINFTADFTVFMVQAIGIPVYKEGTYFTLPSGQWSVVTGCSGIRYFLASVVLGWLFAYLTYRTWWKRLAFGIAALIVPIIANGFRATLIVLIAHYSDMKLALGVDHFIYGWVWFGVVIFLMFMIGNIWREDPEPAPKGALAPALPYDSRTWRKGTMATASILILIGATSFYGWHAANMDPAPSPLSELTAPEGWIAEDSPMTTWKPEWRGMDDERTLFLTKGSDRIMLYVAWYGTQRQDAELINSTNRLIYEKHPEWRKSIENQRTVTLGTTPTALKQGHLDSHLSGQRLLAWHWNRIAGENMASDLRGKATIATRKLLGQNDAGAVIILAAPYTEKPMEAERTMIRFWQEAAPEITGILDKAMQ
jgi:exosortase A